MKKLSFFSVFCYCCLNLLPLPARAANETPAETGAEYAVVRPALQETILTGYTRPRTRMVLSSEENGRCIEVFADIGEPIGANGIFARLDTTFISLDIQRNEADRKRVQAEVAFYNKEVERYRKLLLNETVSQSEYDLLVQKYTSAQQQLNALNIQDRSLREHHKRYTLKGPPGWFVIQRHAEPGEWISSGQAVAELGDFRTLLVPFALSPSEYQWLSAQEKNSLTLTDLNITVQAHIERSDPDFDPETRKINTDLEIIPGSHQLRGGLRAELKLQRPDKSGVLLIRKNAVEERFDEFWVTKSDGTRIQVVNIGNGPENAMRVISPKLQPGDKLIIPAKKQ